METLFGRELLEAHGESRLAIDATEAAHGTLQMNPHLSPHVCAFAHDGFHVLARTHAKRGNALRGNGKLNPRHDAVCENLHAGILRERFLRAAHQRTEECEGTEEIIHRTHTIHR